MNHITVDNKTFHWQDSVDIMFTSILGHTLKSARKVQPVDLHDAHALRVLRTAVHDVLQNYRREYDGECLSRITVLWRYKVLNVICSLSTRGVIGDQRRRDGRDHQRGKGTLFGRASELGTSSKLSCFWRGLVKNAEWPWHGIDSGS